MVKKKRLLLPLLALLVLLLLSGAVFAAVGPARVVDQSKTFTEAQFNELTTTATKLGDKYTMDIIIVTTDDTGGKSSMAYADDYFDSHNYGVGEGKDGILFLMDFDNRQAYISTSGSGIRYLTDARIESILDDVFAGGMTSGDYYGAASAFLKSTTHYLEAGIPSNQYSVGDNSLTAAEGVIGFLIAGVFGVGFFSSTQNQYKGHPQRAVFEYQKNSLVSLTPFEDNHINTFVTTIRIPRNTGTGSGSGRSSTHQSSGGGTHGGGGRGF